MLRTHLRQMANRSLRLMTAAVVLMAVARLANAQYYNSDAGHSLRVEDATPQPLRSLSLDVLNAKAERLIGGTTRYRYEPSVDWGVLPLTELGIRFPLIVIKPSGSSALRHSTGLAGIAIGGVHAFTIETPGVPALAIASEVLLPVGALSADQASFAVKALVTKRFGFGRVHFNVGGGNYSVRSNPPANNATPCDPAPRTRFGSPFQGSCDDPPIIVDAPCSMYVDDDPVLSSSVEKIEQTPTPLRRNTPAVQATSQTTGRGRWSAAVGVDHAFALRSTSVGVDYVAEHFLGLYSLIDQTAEIGFRTQATPSTIMHGVASWHFAGVVQSFSIGAGVTMELAWPFVHWHARK